MVIYKIWTIFAKDICYEEAPFKPSGGGVGWSVGGGRNACAQQLKAVSVEYCKRIE